MINPLEYVVNMAARFSNISANTNDGFCVQLLQIYFGTEVRWFSLDT